MALASVMSCPWPQKEFSLHFGLRCAAEILREPRVSAGAQKDPKGSKRLSSFIQSSKALLRSGQRGLDIVFARGLDGALKFHVRSKAMPPRVLLLRSHTGRSDSTAWECILSHMANLLASGTGSDSGILLKELLRHLSDLHFSNGSDGSLPAPRFDPPGREQQCLRLARDVAVEGMALGARGKRGIAKSNLQENQLRELTPGKLASS